MYSVAGMILAKGPEKGWSFGQAFSVQRLVIGLAYNLPECLMHSGDFCCMLRTVREVVVLLMGWNE